MAVLIYASGIFILSSSSNPPSDSDLGLSIPSFDKIAHFLLYFIFGLLLYMAILESTWTNVAHLSYFSGTLYAFFDEVHQYFVPERSADPLDFLTDAVALAIAAYLMSRMYMEKTINEEKN